MRIIVGSVSSTKRGSLKVLPPHPTIDFLASACARQLEGDPSTICPMLFVRSSGAHPHAQGAHSSFEASLHRAMM
ncbi:MAG: hypothetical protein WKF84_08145 [Pyrinomonadaceae bacterium]